MLLTIILLTLLWVGTVWTLGWLINHQHNELLEAQEREAGLELALTDAEDRIYHLQHPKLSHFEQLLAKHKEDSKK